MSCCSSLTIAYVTIGTYFQRYKTYTKYIITLMIILPVNILLYYKYFQDPTYIYFDGHFKELLMCSIATNFLIIFFIGLYGYVLYKRGKPIGEFVTPLMCVLFILIVYDTFDLFTEYYDITLPDESYLILTTILILTNLILFGNLVRINTEAGKIIERMLYTNEYYGLKIVEKKTLIDEFLDRINNYFKIFPNRILFIVLMVLSSILFLTFFPGGYNKGILITLGVAISVIIYYLNKLYNKRNKTNNLM